MNFQAAVSAAWNKIQGMIDGFIVMLPNLVLAAIVFAIFFFGARWFKFLVKRLTRRYRNAWNLGLVLGRLAQGIIIFVGLFVALSIVIPTFKAGSKGFCGLRQLAVWWQDWEVVRAGENVGIKCRQQEDLVTST